MFSFFLYTADDGNRTRLLSLGSLYSTDELHLHTPIIARDGFDCKRKFPPNSDRIPMSIAVYIPDLLCV